MVKFLRRDCARFSKFGNGRGKKAKWRAPKGRDNKMREGIKGHPVCVAIGYGNPAQKAPLMVNNTNELLKATKEDIIIVGKVGKKKQIEIANKAKELGLNLKNINVEAFLKKLNKENKK